MQPMTFSRLHTALAITVLAAMTLLPVTLVSTAAGFILLGYVPGRLLLRWLGLEDHWSSGGRTVLSTALSWAIVPFFLNIIWHQTNSGYVLLLAVWGGALVLAMTRQPPHPANGFATPTPFFEHRATRWAAAFTAAVIVFSTITPYWPTELFGYPIPSQIHDFVKHHALIDSLEKRPLPLGNLFYADGAELPAYYYHFFYLIPATVRAWTRFSISIELVFGLGSAMVALSTAGIIYAFAKRFSGSEMSGTLAAALVTLVGSLDFILFVPFMFDIGRPLICLDSWTVHPYIVHDVIFQMVWSPQNMTALLATLTGAYLLSSLGARPRPLLLLGPIIGATIVGSSVWVALGALPALALWALTRPKMLRGAVLVGVLMTIACLPTLHGYSESSKRHGKAMTFKWSPNSNSPGQFVFGKGITANLVDLPLTLTLEFGGKFLFLMFVPAFFWKKLWKDDGLRWLCIAGILAVVSFRIVRTELQHNDFGQKIIMLAQVITAILAGCALAPDKGRSWWGNPLGWQLRPQHRSRFAHAFFAGALLIGLPRGLWECPMLGMQRYIRDARGMGSFAIKDKDARNAVMASERACLKWMRYHLPPDAVVQAEGSFRRATLAQLIRRQIGVLVPQDDVMVFDPADKKTYRKCVYEVIYTLRRPHAAEETYETLRRHKITHVFIGSWELAKWPNLERFEDEHYFREVHRDGRCVVVELHQAPAPPSADEGDSQTPVP